jgi:cytidine deaminase
MQNMTNEELIQKATSVINERKTDQYTVGQVGSALITDKGNIYTGVCIDTGSGMGFCAEASAIASMITAGEHKIKKIVATWKDEKGDLYIASPCGRCREFISTFDESNINAEVILDKNAVSTLKELLPHRREYNKV